MRRVLSLARWAAVTLLAFVGMSREGFPTPSQLINLLCIESIKEHAMRPRLK